VSAALPQLRQHLEAMRGAINETLRLLRPRGRCLVCGVREGAKHDPDCPVWPIINARSAYAAASDPSLFEPTTGGEDNGAVPLLVP
jgi:hypothetical protein